MIYSALFTDIYGHITDDAQSNTVQIIFVPWQQSIIKTTFRSLNLSIKKALKMFSRAIFHP